MDRFINEMELKKPPIISIPIKNAGFVEQMYLIFTQVSTGNAQKELAQPAALLGRLIARRKNSFRKLSGFKNLCKLNNALCRLLRLNLNRVLEDFRDALTSESVDKETEVDIPSRNNFIYVLVRILGINKILQRVYSCCSEASKYIVNLLQNNFFLEINTVLLAVVARIKNITVILTNKFTKFYNILSPYQQHLPQNKVNFLPVGAELPKKLSLTTFKLAQHTTVLSTKTVTKPTIMVTKSFHRKKFVDMGAEVVRESVTLTFDIRTLNTLANVYKFIREEQTARQNAPNTCITKSILNHEWKGAVKMFKRKIEANEYKKAFLLFQNFLNSRI